MPKHDINHINLVLRLKMVKMTKAELSLKRNCKWAHSRAVQGVSSEAEIELSAKLKEAHAKLDEELSAELKMSFMRS